MSATAEQITAIPAGTWNVDPVHSDVGFAVTYSGAGTFRGGFKELDAKLVDGKPRGERQGRERQRRRTAARRPPPVARLLRRRAAPRADVRLEVDRARRRDEVTIDGELTLRGVTKPVTIDGDGRRPDAGRLRQPADRVRRRDHDRSPRVRHRLEPGPPGRRSRARQRREDHRQPRAGAGVAMKILAISGSLRQGSHNTDLLRGAAAGAPDGVDIELYHGLKEIPPYDADDDVPGDQPIAVAAVQGGARLRPTRSWSRRPSTTRRFQAC